MCLEKLNVFQLVKIMRAHQAFKQLWTGAAELVLVRLRVCQHVCAVNDLRVQCATKTSDCVQTVCSRR